jgi:hypothetical protein
MLSKLGFKHGISPKLISTKLLDAKDKQDLLSDGLSENELSLHVAIWVKNGSPDYVELHNPVKPLPKEPVKSSKFTYRAPFIERCYLDT